MVNLWRDLEVGPSPPTEVHVVIESTKGSRNKFVYDLEKGVLMLDRVLHSCVHYPGDFGFIPQTYSGDGEPLDALVLVEDSTFPGCIIECRPVAILRMRDSEMHDDKLVSVPAQDPRFDHIEDVADLPAHLRDEIEHFFLTYKNLEPKPAVASQGWNDVKVASRVIERARATFQKEVVDRF